MKIMIISGSPNNEGLADSFVKQAQLGISNSGAEALDVRLNDLSIGMCRTCSKNGWGTCLEEHTCQVEDDFQKNHAAMDEMDGFVIISPVYWGDMSETTKAFLDRVRRCEGFKKEKHFLKGKPIITVAIAGGTGNGCISCLATMERFIEHVQASSFDTIAVSRRNRNYKSDTIVEAVTAMLNRIQKQKKS